MPRFFAEILEDGTALIQGKDAAHIAGPLRMRAGEELPIRVQDQGYRARLTTVSSPRVTLEILAAEELMDRSARRIYLAIGMLGPTDMDEIVRLASELGVSQIIPVLTKRSNIRKVNDARYKRWEDIIQETVKVTQRRSVPGVQPLTSLEDFITQASAWPCRCVGLQQAAAGIDEIDASEIGILIGPEGGFAPEEVELLQTSGFLGVTMGRTNLRTVSAAIAAAAILAR